jgi:hypothetical protein
VIHRSASLLNRAYGLSISDSESTSLRRGYALILPVAGDAVAYTCPLGFSGVRLPVPPAGIYSWERQERRDRKVMRVENLDHDP